MESKLELSEEVTGRVIAPWLSWLLAKTDPGKSLDRSGAALFQGKSPARLNPFCRRQGLARHFSVTSCSSPMTEYLVRTWPVFLGSVCHFQAKSFLQVSKEDKVKRLGKVGHIGAQEPGLYLVFFAESCSI